MKRNVRFWAFTALEIMAFAFCFRHFGAVIVALIFHGLADRAIEKENLPENPRG